MDTCNLKFRKQYLEEKQNYEATIFKPCIVKTDEQTQIKSKTLLKEFFVFFFFQITHFVLVFAVHLEAHLYIKYFANSIISHYSYTLMVFMWQSKNRDCQKSRTTEIIHSYSYTTLFSYNNVK